MRFQYDIPKSKAFRVASVDRKKLVSAGLCEELIVEFQLTDTQLTCVEDCIRVNCHEISSKRAGKIETIVVLLRASARDIRFPVIALSTQTPTLTVPMSNCSSGEKNDRMPPLSDMSSLKIARPQRQMRSVNVKHFNREKRLKEAKDQKLRKQSGEDFLPRPKSSYMSVSSLLTTTEEKSQQNCFPTEILISQKSGGANSTIIDPQMQLEDEDGYNESARYLRFESFPIVENDDSYRDTRDIPSLTIDLNICPFQSLPTSEQNGTLLIDDDAMSHEKLPFYVPLMCHKRLREGAMDEITPSVRLSSGKKSIDTTNYAFSLADNFDSSVFLGHSRSSSPLLTCDSSRETDPWHLLHLREDIAETPAIAQREDTQCFDAQIQIGAVSDQSNEISLSPFIHKTHRLYPSESIAQSFVDPNSVMIELNSLYQKTDRAACFSTISDPFIELEEGVTFATHLETIAYLSDSDSEDENENDYLPIEYQSIPTWRQACSLFEVNFDHEESEFENPSVLLPNEYAHASLENDVRATRERLRQRLPNRLEAVAREFAENSLTYADLIDTGPCKVHQPSECTMESFVSRS